MIKLKDLLNEDRSASILQHQERELERAIRKGDEDEIYTLRNAIAYTKSKMKKETVDEKWQTFKGLRILPSGAIGDVVYFKDKKEMMKAFREKKAKPIHEETLMKEGVDLYSHVKAVEQHLDDFRKDLDRKRGGSYESDSIEYETDRWENNSKKLKGRDKKLGMWEKKVKKSFDNLIKDFEKAWK